MKKELFSRLLNIYFMYFFICFPQSILSSENDNLLKNQIDQKQLKQSSTLSPRFENDTNILSSPRSSSSTDKSISISPPKERRRSNSEKVGHDKKSTSQHSSTVHSTGISISPPRTRQGKKSDMNCSVSPRSNTPSLISSDSSFSNSSQSTPEKTIGEEGGYSSTNPNVKNDNKPKTTTSPRNLLETTESSKSSSAPTERTRSNSDLRLSRGFGGFLKKSGSTSHPSNLNSPTHKSKDNKREISRSLSPRYDSSSLLSSSSSSTNSSLSNLDRMSQKETGQSSNNLGPMSDEMPITIPLEVRVLEASEVVSFLNSNTNKFAHYKVVGKLTGEDIAKLCTGEFSAQQASIDWTQCEGISPFFPQLMSCYWDPSFAVLDVTEKDAKDPVFGHLALALNRNKTLTAFTMHLDDSFEKQISNIIETLCFHPIIKLIDLSGSCLGGFGTLVGKVLANNTALATFNLKQCGLLAQDASVILEGLEANRTLQTLDLSLNRLSKSGTYFKSMLRTNTTLTALNLYGNLLDLTFVQHIAEALTQTLLSFDSSNKACPLYQPQFLRTLNLGSNNMGDTGVEHIATVLTSNTVLTELNLSKNKISGEGALYISEALPNNRALRILNLGDNQLGDVGTSLIVQSLFKNTTLNTLNLPQNQVSNASVKLIQELFKKNTSLAALDLGANLIDGQNCLNLIGVFKRNTALRMLNLDFCSITVEGSQYIVTIWGETESVQVFDFGNKAYSDMYHFIHDSLKSNKKHNLRKASDSTYK